VYIKLYVSETYETNSRSNAIYRKTLRTFVPIQYFRSWCRIFVPFLLILLVLQHLYYQQKSNLRATSMFLLMKLIWEQGLDWLEFRQPQYLFHYCIHSILSFSVTSIPIPHFFELPSKTKLQWRETSENFDISSKTWNQVPH